jgi:hypothetical protein
MQFDQVRHVALALPDTSEAPHFEYTSFRVRGKIFATAPPSEECLHLFVGEEDRVAMLALEPEFVEELIWGKKVIGLHITLARAKPEIVADLLRQAWFRKAPKRLTAQIANPANEPELSA